MITGTVFSHYDYRPSIRLSIGRVVLPPTNSSGSNNWEAWPIIIHFSCCLCITTIILVIIILDVVFGLQRACGQGSTYTRRATGRRQRVDSGITMKKKEEEGGPTTFIWGIRATTRLSCQSQWTNGRSGQQSLLGYRPSWKASAVRWWWWLMMLLLGEIRGSGCEMNLWEMTVKVVTDRSI